jgi:hypothetical protein
MDSLAEVSVRHTGWLWLLARTISHDVGRCQMTRKNIYILYYICACIGTTLNFSIRPVCVFSFPFPMTMHIEKFENHCTSLFIYLFIS